MRSKRWIGSLLVSALVASCVPDLAAAQTARPAAKKSTARKAGTAAKTSGTRSRAKPQGGANSTRPARPAAPKPVWPVKGPEALPGAILPGKRIIAYYGNPLSRRMGILGEIAPEAMLRRLDREVEKWTRADTAVPAIPALHLIVTVAQGSPGADGMWRARMKDELVEQVYEWAARRNALVFLDVQVGKSNLRAELPRLEKFLSRPNVHLGVDPEFSMKTGHAPGKRIGTMDAKDINYASEFLQEIVDKYRIPPKVLVVHRFTRPMLTNYRNIKLDPRVQIVIQMDGWGNPELKKGSYVHYVYSEPVQYTGFKIFYKNDTKKSGWRLMQPEDVLALEPRPLYVQYQ